jgi:hypothetical protein
VKEALESFKVASTGRWAVSIRTYVLTVPFAILMNVERENILNPGNVSRSIAICMAGELVSWLYLFIAQATLLKHRRVRQQRLSKCLFVWFSAGVVKSLGFVAYSIWVFDYEPDLAVRTILPTVFTGVSSAILAFYFGTIDKRRIENNALTALDAYLLEDKESLFSRDGKARLEAITTLKNSLEPEIERLQNIASGMNQEISEMKNRDALRKILRLASEIETRIDKEVMNLAEKPDGKYSNSQNADAKQIYFGLEPKVISVRLTAIAITLGMFAGQITRNGPRGVASGALGVVFLTLIVFILRRISKKLTASDLRKLIIISYPVVFIIQMVYVNNISPLFFDLTNPYMPWYSAMKTVYGYYLASVIAGLLIENTEKLSVARIAHTQLTEEISELNRDQILLNNHIMLTRFGTIKGKIAGVSMALNLMLDTSPGSEKLNTKNALLVNAIGLLSEANEEIERLDLEKHNV